IFLPVFTLMACSKLILPVFGLHFFHQTLKEKPAETIRVMTWNVHGLGIYDRPRDKSVPKKMLKLINAHNPDILCLIEFYTDIKNGFEPHGNEFVKEGAFREYRFSWDNTLGKAIFVGTAIFSKYPLSNFKTTQISKAIKLVQCDIELPGNVKTRGFFVHLQSFYLSEKDKKKLEEIKNTGKFEENLPYSKTVANKFLVNYKLRAQQADKVVAVIAQSPYPVLVCADLNDQPMSYTYSTIKGELVDVFAKKGRGFGRTYNLLSPTLRIDHIFYNPTQLKILDCQIPKTTLSDHNPVVATFQMRKPK